MRRTIMKPATNKTQAPANENSFVATSSYH